jgi:catechol 2,3-dioxygenase-like lactoylglutathione lyase family enzyme
MTRVYPGCGGNGRNASVVPETTQEAAVSTDKKLEVVVIPVADAERAKEFYGRLGWRLDADVSRGDFRIVQFTPPGSDCSVQAAHGEHEKRIGAADPDWPDWYAECMMAEQAGTELPK